MISHSITLSLNVVDSWKTVFPSYENCPSVAHTNMMIFLKNEY